MGFYLYDVNGYVGDVASNQGLRLLMEFLDKFGNEELRSLSKKGYTDNPKEASEALTKLISEDGDIQATIDNLSMLLARSEEIGIISNGIVFGSDAPASIFLEGAY